MISIKNALEEIVFVELQRQLKSVHPNMPQSANLSEVAAFSLNRLPSLYASTSRGWLQQRKRAHNELYPQIVNAVRQAIAGVNGDHLRQTPHTNYRKAETPAHILTKLQKVLGHSCVRWQDVPLAFQEALSQASQAAEYAGLSASDRPRLRDTRIYWQQQEVLSLHPNWRSHQDLVNPEFNSYILSASYSLTNVLEELVIREVPIQAQKLATVLPRQVRLDDVAAHVLNRLPAMYATTEQGIAWQTRKVADQLSSRIEATTIESLMTLSKLPRRLDAPIPLQKFEEECEQAIQEIRTQYQREDITWKNILPLITQAIAKEESGQNWRKQWRMLGQIYSEMYLKTGDAEFALEHTTNGEILTIRTHTKRAFGWLADNPRHLAISTLRLFPTVIEIELQSDFWEFSVGYTREEMAIDGII